MLMGIGSRNVAQADLSAGPPDSCRQLLTQTMDRSNREFGRGTAKLSLKGPTKQWEMRQDLRSPCYSPKLSQRLQFHQDISISASFQRIF
ncbi:DUF4113 domain-containing protein [Pseudogulbenkiania ferrooxidans]|uniref:DUF4113 domain-containing protein n=1 Tax=Pseudogulbenkiania ferrooxidans TaxID=549169 RepID=UPI0009DC0AE9